jgi:hypothetical protein
MSGEGVVKRDHAVTLWVAAIVKIQLDHGSTSALVLRTHTTRAQTDEKQQQQPHTLRHHPLEYRTEAMTPNEPNISLTSPTVASSGKPEKQGSDTCAKRGPMTANSNQPEM